ncbi:vacuolar protein sorting-associated protein 72 homolog [Homarus americanus]|nr:vacuolar protein sorting-associated protein 72 homolog [Homarus americanus]XP_042203905.1 vacuolar protein sorting-associated protein 72 homolog [Homarus americanus]XP_042203906.1 vacuolar protein sorting-associated protein 72 homolog [Homarus americanus]XP_042203907.1 vacuolar protein sorting-associated protein 72 homolog [Homarus americanus]XP_042203908.1 vacuolar protein sorting-associated protein 72 homolog [Homarus americanus]
MAAFRDRRNNAGTKMSCLLEEEEEDDFYKTTYGGFMEEADDIDYQSEVEQDDEVDSDFSIDENDEPVSDVEDDGKGGKRKRGRLITKAYKEPKPVQRESTTSKVKEKKYSPKKHYAVFDLAALEKKGIRKSTQLKSAETVKRQRERAEVERKRALNKRDRMPIFPKLTQEELLEEAKLTEEVNIKSLEKYELAELDRKKPKVVRRGFTGSFIRYQSTAMPLIQELKSSQESNLEEPNVEVDVTQEQLLQLDTVQDASENKENTTTVKEVKDDVEKCERTFVTFSDEGTYKRAFRKSKLKVVQKCICPITRLPARYFDPVTQLPYATLQAFRVLREAYYQQLEDKGDRNNKEVAKWLAWRREYKKVRASAQSIKPTVTALQKSTTSSTLSSATRTTAMPTLAPGTTLTQGATYAHTLPLSSTSTSAVTSVAAVAQILRSAAPASSTLIVSTATPNTLPTTTVVAATSLHLGPRPTAATVTTAQAGGGLANLQGQTVQLVQTVGRGIGSTVRPGHQMVVMTSAGPTGGLQLVGGSGGNLLVQGNAGGTPNLLVQGGTSGNVGNLQIVQASGGSGVQVVQASGGGNVQVVQGGRFTIRPVASPAFTNLQSLLK